MHSVVHLPGTQFVCEVPEGAIALPIGGADVLVCGVTFQPFILRMDDAGNCVRRELYPAEVVPINA